MDVIDASYYISNEMKKNKGSQMGHTKQKKRIEMIVSNVLISKFYNNIKIMKFFIF